MTSGGPKRPRIHEMGANRFGLTRRILGFSGENFQ